MRLRPLDRSVRLGTLGEQDQKEASGSNVLPPAAFTLGPCRRLDRACGAGHPRLQPIAHFATIQTRHVKREFHTVTLLVIFMSAQRAREGASGRET